MVRVVPVLGGAREDRLRVIAHAITLIGKPSDFLLAAHIEASHRDDDVAVLVALEGEWILALREQREFVDRDTATLQFVE